MKKTVLTKTKIFPEAVLALPIVAARAKKQSCKTVEYRTVVFAKACLA